MRACVRACVRASVRASVRAMTDAAGADGYGLPACFSASLSVLDYDPNGVRERDTPVPDGGAHGTARPEIGRGDGSPVAGALVPMEDIEGPANTVAASGREEPLTVRDRVRVSERAGAAASAFVCL